MALAGNQTQHPFCPPYPGFLWPHPLGVAPGQSRKYGGKGLSAEKVLEKSLIIELGRAWPVSFFSCADWLWAGQVSCCRDSNPGQPRGHVSSGHLCEGSTCCHQMRPMHELAGLA